MSTHPEITLLSAYVDGELVGDERARLEAHLPGCAECRGTLDAVRAAIADVAALPDVEMSAEQIARLDAGIARERLSFKPQRPRRRLTRIAWAGGAAAASLIAVVMLMQNPDGRDALKSEAPAALNVTEQSSANYSETTARQALAAFASGANATYSALTAKDAARSEGYAPAVGGGTATAAGAGNDAAACDAELRRDAGEPARLVRSEIALFKSQRAFLYFYLVPASDPKRAELWIVRPSDCYTLFFAQQPLK